MYPNSKELKMIDIAIMIIDIQTRILFPRYDVIDEIYILLIQGFVETLSST